MISGSVAAIGQNLQLRLSSTYLFVGSILGIALVTGVAREGGQPSVFRELGQWWQWAVGNQATLLLDVQRWFDERASVCAGVSWLVVLGAVATLAKQRDKSLQTLTSSSLIVGLALGSVTGIAWFGQLTLAICILVVVFVLARMITRNDNFNFENFMMPLVSIILAAIYAPMFLISWLTGDASSEQEALRHRQVLALEKIAKSLPDPDVASGASNVRRLSTASSPFDAYR